MRSGVPTARRDARTFRACDLQLHPGGPPCPVHIVWAAAWVSVLISMVARGIACGKFRLALGCRDYPSQDEAVAVKDKLHAISRSPSHSSCAAANAVYPGATIEVSSCQAVSAPKFHRGHQNFRLEKLRDRISKDGECTLVTVNQGSTSDAASV
ncbi:hypothetical protein Micbo1qcDRAFT_52544 [Microdochium bolleyi]|uniref:Uncharacterized protein n=1 Tax=Microdochium bolleyi TaxID=196109 RepID=A0A136J739_9PEZI|nr:hypothetical protein Micbo1qcDRAFT_52544 [Microdochium bolleyi]